jgi:hypothetical protein
MKVNFYREDDNKWHRERDVPAVPAVGQRINCYGPSDREAHYYEVTQVLYVYEDRPWYVEHKDIGGDRICVTMKPVPGPTIDLAAFIKNARDSYERHRGTGEE